MVDVVGVVGTGGDVYVSFILFRGGSSTFSGLGEARFALSIS